ncbi:hypothetical protein GGS20DRAFT_586945 [Poronia punctata]|nr:hypothetical protein GGS20DRAFT_586945 [Poronia punctata]
MAPRQGGALLPLLRRRVRLCRRANLRGRKPDSFKWRSVVCRACLAAVTRSIVDLCAGSQGKLKVQPRRRQTQSTQSTMDSSSYEERDVLCKNCFNLVTQDYNNYLFAARKAVRFLNNPKNQLAFCKTSTMWTIITFALPTTPPRPINALSALSSARDARVADAVFSPRIATTCERSSMPGLQRARPFVS